MKTGAMAILILAAASTVFGQSTSAISGTIVDDTGAKVNAAIIIAYLQPSGQQKPLAVNTMSAADGTFGFTNLIPGTYQICLEKPQANLLNPCIWNTSPTVVTVAAGGSVNGVSLTAETGVLMNILLSDPQGVLANSSAPHNDILIGAAHATAPFIPARIITTASSGRTLTILVPKAMATNVSVYSKNFVLGDSQGNAFSTPGVQIPVTPSGGTSTASSGTPAPDLTITVKGTAALAATP